MRNALFHHLPTYQSRYEQEHRKSNAMRNIMLVILIFVLNACAACKTRTAVQTPEQIEQEYRSIPRVITLTPVTIEYFDATRCEEDMPCWDCKTMGNKICGKRAK